MVFDESLGGVPVFSLPSVSSCFSKNFSSPVDFFSSILPPSCFVCPIKIVPFRNVPVVKTNAFASYSLFSDIAFSILVLCVLKSFISSSKISIFSFFSFSCIAFS